LALPTTGAHSVLSNLISSVHLNLGLPVFLPLLYCPCTVPKPFQSTYFISLSSLVLQFFQSGLGFPFRLCNIVMFYRVMLSAACSTPSWRVRL
jgi:hypothetical protein